MPGQKQTSEQIHTSVQLFAGLIEESAKPVEKLKKALSCHEEFTKQYLVCTGFCNISSVRF